MNRKTNPQTTLDVSGNITALGWTTNGTLNCCRNRKNAGGFFRCFINISNSGNMFCGGDIDCSGVLALNGANAFYNTSDASNYSNTYLTFFNQVLQRMTGVILDK